MTMVKNKSLRVDRMFIEVLSQFGIFKAFIYICMRLVYFALISKKLIAVVLR